MSDRLTPFSRDINHKRLTRLQHVITSHRLTRIQVADLLGVSRSLVTRWFADHKLCPDRAPEQLRAIMTIRSRENIDQELSDKKLARRKDK